MSERFVVNAEAAIYRDGEYLLVERATEEDHAAGEFALVGGKVERDASDPALESTVRREIREEVGIEVAELVHVTSTTFETATAPCVNVVFLGRHDSGEATVEEPDEIARTIWLDLDAVANHTEVSPFTREYVEKAARRRAALGW